MVEKEFDNGDKHILAFESGKRYCIRNVMAGVNISVFLAKEDALKVMKKRYGTPFAEGNELMECFVSTQHGFLSIYNCKKVKFKGDLK